MRIVLTSGALPRLEGASDFKRFSVAVDPLLRAELAPAVAAIGELADTDHVWVRPDAIRAICPLAGDPDWATGFDAMVGFAAKHGWTNDRGDIRAHVEVLETPAPVEPGVFRDAMRRFASGVCIVAAGEGDARCGMTVSAFTSVSAEPPMVLVCLNRSASAHDCLTGSDRFSINILGAPQEETAMVFAGQRGISGADRFDDLWVQDEAGAPVLTTAHHAIVCAMESQHVSGSHTILVGRVVAASDGNDEGALLNYNGALRQTNWAA